MADLLPEEQRQEFSASYPEKNPFQVSFDILHLLPPPIIMNTRFRFSSSILPRIWFNLENGLNSLPISRRSRQNLKQLSKVAGIVLSSQKSVSGSPFNIFLCRTLFFRESFEKENLSLMSHKEIVKLI